MTIESPNIESGNPDPSREEIILQSVRAVLTKIVKETAVESGMLHPLSIETREDIRRCFVLITQRQQELALIAGRPSQARPHFKDEGQKSMENTVIPIASIKRSPREN